MPKTAVCATLLWCSTVIDRQIWDATVVNRQEIEDNAGVLTAITCLLATLEQGLCRHPAHALQRQSRTSGMSSPCSLI
jgi:hypothetical protein